MQLAELARLFAVSTIIGDPHAEITGIQYDSRKVKPGDLFVCVRGLVQDGHRYAEQAVRAGASALVVEDQLPLDVPMLKVRDSRAALAQIAAYYYGYPSQKMKVIGVTGTNGKTTSVHLMDHILRSCGYKTAVMGTVGTRIGDQLYPSDRTTHESLELQELFRKMLDAGTEYCLMEVSSHALDLGRVKHTRFRTALFTNLTQDHLDYHHTMEEYRQAKGLFFSRLGNGDVSAPEERSYAVLNVDDPASAYYKRLTAVEVIPYGLSGDADVRAENIEASAKGTRFDLVTFKGTVSVDTRLIGTFNVYNVLGAVACVLLEGVSLEQIRNALGSMQPVEGRMETVDEGQDFQVVVDYAHTPDGLENALSAIRGIARGKVITVFGCGGDRDRTKRPLMGAIAARLSDYVIVTSDNPRSEDPEAILKEIEPGIVQAGMGPGAYELEVDRKVAIQKAIDKASPNDVVLIAGKGHETYQIIKDTTLHFDDREEARAALRSRKFK